MTKRTPGGADGAIGRQRLDQILGGEQVRRIREQEFGAQPPLEPVVDLQATMPEDLIDDKERAAMQAATDAEKAANTQDRAEARKAIVAVNFILRDGRNFAFPYPYVMTIFADPLPDTGVQVWTATHRIFIKGRNLTKLHERLLGYRAEDVEESASPFVAEHDEYIESIEVVENL